MIYLKARCSVFQCNAVCNEQVFPSLWLGDVIFFQNWSALELTVFAFFSKRTRRIYANFFKGLGENTCLLKPALKDIAPGL